MEVAEGSDGGEICKVEVPPDMAGEIEVDSTEAGGEIRWPSPPLRAESVEVGLLELGRGISSGPTSSEIVGTRSPDGGDMTLSTSSTGAGSTPTDSDSSVGIPTSIVLSTSTSSDSVSTMVLAFCPQRHSAVP